MPKKTVPLNDALRAILLNRLLFPFVASACVVMSLAAVYGGRLVEKQQMNYNRSIGYTITHFLEHAGYDLSAISEIVPTSSLENIIRNMAANQKEHKIFDTIYYLDSNKKIKALVPPDPRYDGMDMSRRRYFSNLDCEAGVNFSIPFTSLRTGRPTAYLAHCTATGEYIIGELNLHALQETIAKAHGTSSDTVFIVDQTGALLAHPNFELVEQHVNISDSPIVAKGLHGDTSEVYWRDGNFWIGSASRIPPTDWVIVAEVPLITVYAPYIAAIVALTVIFILIFMFSIRVFLLRLQRKLVTPLIYLSMSVDAMASGDYTSTEIRDDDTVPFIEISSLLNNFRNMRRAIYTRETELKESEGQYRRLLEDSPNAILLHSDGIIFYANAAAIKLYGAKDIRDFIDKPIIELVHPDSQPMVQARLQKLKEREQSLPLVEQKHIRFDQTTFEAEVLASSILFAGNYVAQTIIHDITKRKSEEEILKYRATHDPLTDLPNRFLFQDRLEHALIRAKRNKTLGAVLYLDLDSFKSINDAFGHGVGDHLLQDFAASLRVALREDDTVARIGGDEFVVLLDDLKDPLDAEHVANNIIKNLAEPYLVEGQEITISTSMGISIFPNDGVETQALLQSADAAMYKAKEEGKHRVKFYAPYMRSQSLERVELQTLLSHALDEKQLFLQYQPQVNYSTGELIGVEALLRWKHPKLGLVSPAKFIPIAEDTGLILPIGEWVLQTACEQIRQWQDAGLSVRAAINISNLQLKQTNIAQTIQNAINSHQVPPNLLEIELMENIVFRNADSSFSNLYKLKDIGIVLAMDDFGAGFSTLGYLAHIPFDRIKIDQKLVANIENAKDAAVVSGIITICNNLNLEVLAEGVETEEQLTFCVSNGCNLFQGWYYSRAVDPALVTQYLSEGVPWKPKI